MTRISKQGEKRRRSPRKRQYSLAKKTGSKEVKGFKEHINALDPKVKAAFIPKM